MNSYRLSEAADADIEHILERSIEAWGFDRAEAYLLSLHHTFGRLAEFPNSGRDVSSLRSGYFRAEHESHSIFYRKITEGILIMRVLHQKMQPKRHL